MTRQRKLISVAALCLLVATPSFARPVVTFDDISVPTDVAAWSGTRYAALGVTFQAASGSQLLAATGSFDTAPIFVGASHVWPRADAAITMLFSGLEGASPGIGFVTFNVIDHAGAPESNWNASAYNALGQLLGSITNNGGTYLNPFPVTFTRAAADIQKVVFTPSDEYEGIDTLQFAVPAPSSALLGLGLIAGARRRRA